MHDNRKLKVCMKNSQNVKNTSKMFKISYNIIVHIDSEVSWAKLQSKYHIISDWWNYVKEFPR